MIEHPIMEISIPSVARNSGHTEYLVHLITNNPFFDRHYVAVYRRYSEFLILHKKLKLHIPALPDFPPKILFSSLRSGVVESRREKLQQYIRYACEFVVRNNFEGEKFGKALIEFLK